MNIQPHPEQEPFKQVQIINGGCLLIEQNNKETNYTLGN